MNAAVGDVLNQGSFAIYVSNISEEGVLVQGNNLWMPRAGTSGERVKFENMANAMGVEMGGWSFGAQFGDLNNDGFLDIYVTNGNVSLDRNEQLLVRLFESRRRQQSDHLRCGELAADGRPQLCRGYQQKTRLAQRWRRASFNEVAQLVGVTDVYDGRAVALATSAIAAVLDVVVANQRGPVVAVQEYGSPEHRWIEFDLEGAEQPQRHRRAGAGFLEWPTAGSGSFRRQRLLRAEPATSALWAGQRPDVSTGRDSLAIRQDADC